MMRMIIQTTYVPTLIVAMRGMTMTILIITSMSTVTPVQSVRRHLFKADRSIFGEFTRGWLLFYGPIKMKTMLS